MDMRLISPCCFTSFFPCIFRMVAGMAANMNPITSKSINKRLFPKESIVSIANTTRNAFAVIIIKLADK